MDIIFVPLGIDESKNKRRYLNGQVISQSQFPAFTSAVKARMTTMANAFTTETNWQTEKTNSKLGQCGKFVVDDTAGTIRLPCVVNAQGLADLSLIGGIKNESLPNIMGYFYATNRYVPNDNVNVTGAFTYDNMHPETFGSSTNNNSDTKFSGIRFNASRSSSAYQDNAPVQQEAVQYPYCIVVNTGVEEPDRPINNYQVNNVYSYGMSQYYKGTMNNNSWLKSAGQWNNGTVYTGMYNWLLEQMNNGVSGFVASTATYTDYDFVINTTDQAFRLPLKNGQEGVFADGVKGNGMTLGITDGTNNYGLNTWNPQYGNALIGKTGSYGTDIGSAATGEVSINNISSGITTDPTKSGMIVDKTVPSGWNLYYYVGDTLQNAQLINIVRIEETLLNKTNKVQAAEASMPSGKYIDLTLGASGSTYTAPANGWFAFYCESVCDSRIVTKGGLFGNTALGKSGFANNNTVNVLKGDTVTLIYSSSIGASLRFYYCEGETNV